MQKGFRTIVIVIVVVALVLSVSLYAFWPRETKKERLLYALSWTIYGVHAPYFVAKEMGFYDEVGLEVDVVRGYGSSDTAKRIATGSCDLGEADWGSLALARSEGLELKAVGLYDHSSSGTIYSHPENPVLVPMDMEGKTYGASPWEIGQQLLPQFCELNGVDISKITVINAESDVKLTMFAQGDLDTIFEQFEHLETQEKILGIDIVTLDWRDWGLEMYGASIAATDVMIKEKPDVIARFLAATYKGMQWTIKNQSEAIDILLRYHPELVKEDELSTLKTVASKIWVTNEVNEKGFDYIDPEKALRSQQLGLFGGAGESFPVEEMYTTQFYKGIFPD